MVRLLFALTVIAAWHVCVVAAPPPSRPNTRFQVLQITQNPQPGGPPPAPAAGGLPQAPELPEVFDPDQVRLPSLPEAQGPLGTTPKPSPATLQKFGRYVERVIDPENTLDVIIGRPRVIVLKQNPARFQLEEEQIARVIPLFENRQLSITGLRVGTTILNLWFGDPNNPDVQTVLSYLLRVLPDPEAKLRLERVYDALGKEINRLFPDSVVRLTLAGDKVVITGQAKDTVEASQIIQIVSANAPGQARFQGALQGGGAGQGQGPAAGIPLPVTQFSTAGVNPYTGNLNQVGETIPGMAGAGLPPLENYLIGATSNIINLLRVPGEMQVMLKVTVAEVDRAASRTIGMDFAVEYLSHGQAATVFSSSLSGQPLPTGGSTNNSGAATGGSNITASIAHGQFESTITALRTLNFARTLAEPNLVTTNGQPASFLAGGEFPVPVTSGFATNIQGVQFVPFGVQLRFIPYVTDKDRIRLVVSSNVTTRNLSSGATIGGATVSGLNSRNFYTTVELRDGQTIAVAGLIQNSYGATATRVPFFGDLPIIGRFAALDGSSSDEQELVILISPRLVHPYDPHQVPPLPGSDIFEPGDLEFYLLGRLESLRPYDYRAGVRTDIHRMLRYRHCDDIFISGPHGHAPPP